MKANLLLVLHFHQPVGNFDSVVKKIYDRCYKPFLETVSQYPQIKLNLHFSGNLLEWFQANTPEILKIIKGLVEKGQVELMGGAIYEPILPVIPERDRIGQIESMRRYIDHLFNTKVKSAWIPERVWEPHLVSSLAKAGVEYVMLDDTHLMYAGIKKEDTYGYYISEDNGSIVRVFPSDKPLRYTIPFSEPDESFEYMKKVSENITGAIFTYGDDVEKFGEWPGTHKLVYEDKWLEKFLRGLSKNSNWLRTLTLSECIRDFAPSGKVYLPTASYEELLEWALPIDSAIAFQKIKDEIGDKKEKYLPFIRGGFFRNFLAKYYEVNQMHKRMLYVSNLLGQLKEADFPQESLKEANRELYRSQCNCAYWHGLFGGLYLYHLRRTVYEHLLKAEKIYNDMTQNIKKPECEIMDFDADGSNEVILQNKDIWLCAKPAAGGSIVEFDVKRKYFNFLNILTRYREFYHEGIAEKLTTEKGKQLRLHQKSKSDKDILRLSYDKYRKAMFVDHFFGKGVNLSNFEKADYIEKGDFINSSYDFKVIKEREVNSLIMERKGSVHGVDVKIVKELLLKDLNLNIVYRITNLGGSESSFHFGTEIPFIMPDADSSRYAYFLDNKRGDAYDIASSGSSDGLSKLEIADEKGEIEISLTFSKEYTLWRFPIMTISQSEKGYEENYQGSVIVPSWHFILGANETFRLEGNLTCDLKTPIREKDYSTVGKGVG